MATVYTVSEHPLLKADASNEDLFAANTAIAAELLGVDETVYTGADLATVERAIVLQLNYMAKLKPEMFIYTAEASAHSKQSVSYRNPADLALIYPFALALVRKLNRRLGLGWDNIKAVR